MSDPNLSVIKNEAGAVARPTEAPNVADMLKAIVDKGISPENVGALEKIVGLYERMEDKNSERTFSAALVRLQSDVRNVKAIRPVIINGTVRYKFAPYEDLMNEVAPHLASNGFTISYSTKIEGDRVTKTLRLRHACGHVEPNDYSCKISKQITNRDGNATVSEAQMESMASTTAKRGALCDALNIVIEKYEQDDARNEGGAISAAQTQDLQARVKALRVNEAQFLAYAKAKTYPEIVTTAWDRLDEYLTRKAVEARASLKKRVLAAGGDPQDLAESSGAANFEAIPSTALEGVDEIVRKMEGK